MPAMVWRLVTLRRSAVLLLVLPACVAAATVGLIVRVRILVEGWEVRELSVRLYDSTRVMRIHVPCVCVQGVRGIGIALWCSEIVLWLLCRVLVWRWPDFWSSPPLSAPASHTRADGGNAAAKPFIFSPACAVTLIVHCAVGVALVAKFSNHDGDASDTTASNGAVGALGVCALLVAEAGLGRGVSPWPRYASMAMLVTAIVIGASVKALASLVVASCLLLIVVLAHIAVLCGCWDDGVVFPRRGESRRRSTASGAPAAAAADGDEQRSGSGSGAVSPAGTGDDAAVALPDGVRMPAASLNEYAATDEEALPAGRLGE
jgi:hypothetical protein